MRTSHAVSAAPTAPRGGRVARLLAASPAAFALVCAFACALVAPPSRAQSDAFSAEVAVADRGAEERAAAYAEALRRVLLDNAADRTLMNRDDVREALREADAYVETFRFDAPRPGTGIPPGTPVTDAVRRSGEAEGLLLVRFDRARVLALIDGGDGVGTGGDAAGRADAAPGAGPAALAGSLSGPLSGPGAERAFDGVGSVLVWLLVEDGERVVRGDDPAARKVRERLREIAGGAGVSIAFGDAGDLDLEALRALDVEAVRAASLRYATDAVLAARLARGVDAPDGAGDVSGGVSSVPADAGAVRDDVGSGAAPGAAGIDLRDRLPRPAPDPDAGWRGEWLKATVPDAPAGGTSDDPEAGSAPRAVALRTLTTSRRLDDALRDGLGWLLPELASGAGATYAYGGGGDATEGLVWVGSLDSVAEYARVMALFESVGGVDSVYPRTVADGAGVFAVRPRRALDAIVAAAAGTGWLRRGAPPLDVVDPAAAPPGGGVNDGVRDALRRLSGRDAGRRGERGDGRDAAGATRGETFADLARQADLAFDAVP